MNTLKLAPPTPDADAWNESMARLAVMLAHPEGWIIQYDWERAVWNVEVAPSDDVAFAEMDIGPQAEAETLLEAIEEAYLADKAARAGGRS